MTNSLDQFLQQVQAAQGDAPMQAALAAEFALSVRPPAEAAALRAALDAAALLHWFESDRLACLLEITPEQAAQRYAALQALPFVEAYRRQDSAPAYNVHEATRLGWRRRLAQQRPEAFRALSLRAAEGFAEDDTPIGRIEYVYHLLCGDPERGADAAQALDRAWTGLVHPEDYAILAAAMQELVDSNLLQGRARAWALLISGSARHERGETAQLGALADEALRLAMACGDMPVQADAHCLSGDVLLSQGKLAEAAAAYTEYLAICQRLLVQDADSSAWQRDLAVAYSKVGDVRQAQGRLAEARVAYGEDLAIMQRLAEQDSGNAAWQRDLAVAYGRMGDILRRVQGQLAEALAAYEDDLVIQRRLVAQDFGNADWQRELAVVCGKVGEVYRVQGRLAEALWACEEDLTICQRLVKLDADNAGWQRDLAWAHVRLARLAAAKRNRKEALRHYEEALRLYKALLARAPDFVEWRREYDELKAEVSAFRKQRR